MTLEILQKLFQSLDRSLVDTRFMAMALLAFAGFLRFHELANLKLKDLALHDTHFELFIESSKTDQYRKGAIVPIVKSGTDLCPWGNLEKYLSLAKLTLPKIFPRWGRLFVQQYSNKVWLSVHPPRLQTFL